MTSFTTALMGARTYLGVYLALSTLAGCSASQQEESSTPEPGVAQCDTPPVTPTSCADYSEAVCTQVGASSDVCAAVQITTGIMSPRACALALDEVPGIASGQAINQVCLDLADRLCEDMGESSEMCSPVQTQLADEVPATCENMVEVYPEVLAELQALEQAGKPLSSEIQARLIAGTPPAFGPLDAPITIVEFSDFECPFCSQAAAVLDEVKRRYPKQVRVVFRQFPLGFHHHAHLTAQASLAAHKQGKFWAFHDRVFTSQSDLTRASLEKIATEVGLNLQAFQSDLDARSFADNVDQDLSLGREIFVDGTPTGFINGIRLSNLTDLESVIAEIEAILLVKRK